MRKYIQEHTAKLDAIIRYGIAAILIAVPIYPKFPFLNVPGIYVSIRVEDFLILIVTLAWVARNYTNIANLWKNSIIRAVALFLVATFLATFIGIVFLHTASFLVALLEWGRRVEYLMGFIIGLTSIKSIKDIEFYVKCIIVVLAIVFAFGLGQKYLGAPVITTQNQEYSKGIALRYVPGTQLVSTFAGHYDLASYVLLTTPIFVGLFFAKKESLQDMFGYKNQKAIRVFVFIIIAVSFWLMVNAASRITAVAYIVSISTTLFLIRKYKYIPVVVVAMLVFAFSTSSLFDRYLNIFQVIKNKLMGMIVPTAYAQSPAAAPAAPVSMLEDRSTSIRLSVEWPRAIRAFLKNPLLGTGYSSTTLATDNDYLRVLGETGIIGAVATFFVFFRIIKEFILKSWPRGIFSKKEIDFKTVYLAGIIGAIPGILLNALFIDVFEASKFAIPFWFLVGFGIALLYEKNIKNS